MQNWNQWQIPAGTVTTPMPQPPIGYPAPGADPMAMMQAYMQYYNQPAPSGYTAEQWAAAQQQNWVQWQQWQQQFQQWQTQYGEKYQETMKQLSTQGMSTLATQAPPLPTMQPPPLPKEETIKPPLPPESTGTQYQFTTVPPPHQNNLPLFPSKQSASSAGTSAAASSYLQNPPLPPNQPPLPGQPGGETLSANKRGISSIMETSSAKKFKIEDELTEAEKTFDAQFKQWEEQFNKWKQQNANHPDKTQYKQYEAKWTSWREKLIERREQMRRKREQQKQGSAKTEGDKNKILSGGEKIMNILSNTENQGLINNLLGIGKSLGLSTKQDTLAPAASTANTTSLATPGTAAMPQIPGLVQLSGMAPPTMTADMTQAAWAAQQWAAQYNAGLNMTNFSNIQAMTGMPPPPIGMQISQMPAPPSNFSQPPPNFSQPPPGFGSLDSRQAQGAASRPPQGNVPDKPVQPFGHDDDDKRDSFTGGSNDRFGSDGQRFGSNDRSGGRDNQFGGGNDHFGRDESSNDFSNSDRNLGNQFSSRNDQLGRDNRDFDSNSRSNNQFRPDDRFDSRNDRFGRDNDHFGSNDKGDIGNDRFNRDAGRFGDQTNRFSTDKDNFGAGSDRFGSNNDRFGRLTMDRFDQRDLPDNRRDNFGNNPRGFNRSGNQFDATDEIAPELKKLMEKRRAAMDVFKPRDSILSSDSSIGVGSLSESFKKITGDSPFASRSSSDFGSRDNIGMRGPDSFPGRGMGSFGPRGQEDFRSRGPGDFGPRGSNDFGNSHSDFGSRGLGDFGGRPTNFEPRGMRGSEFGPPRPDFGNSRNDIPFGPRGPRPDFLPQDREGPNLQQSDNMASNTPTLGQPQGRPEPMGANVEQNLNRGEGPECRNMDKDGGRDIPPLERPPWMDVKFPDDHADEKDPCELNPVNESVPMKNRESIDPSETVMTGERLENKEPEKSETDDIVKKSDALPFMGENDPKPEDLNMEPPPELPNLGPITERYNVPPFDSNMGPIRPDGGMFGPRGPFDGPFGPRNMPFRPRGPMPFGPRDTDVRFPPFGPRAMNNGQFDNLGPGPVGPRESTDAPFATRNPNDGQFARSAFGPRGLNDGQFRPRGSDNIGPSGQIEGPRAGIPSLMGLKIDEPRLSDLNKIPSQATNDYEPNIPHDPNRPSIRHCDVDQRLPFAPTNMDQRSQFPQDNVDFDRRSLPGPNMPNRDSPFGLGGPDWRSPFAPSRPNLDRQFGKDVDDRPLGYSDMTGGGQRPSMLGPNDLGPGPELRSFVGQGRPGRPLPEDHSRRDMGGRPMMGDLRVGSIDSFSGPDNTNFSSRPFARRPVEPRRLPPGKEFCIENKFNYNHGGVTPDSYAVEHVPAKVIEYSHAPRPPVQDHLTPAQSFDYGHGALKPVVPEHEIYSQRDFRHWEENEQNLKEYADRMRPYEHDIRWQELRHSSERRLDHPMPRDFIREERRPFDRDRRPYDREDNRNRRDRDDFRDRPRDDRTWDRGRERERESRFRNERSISKDRNRDRSERNRKDTSKESGKDEERSKGNNSWQECPKKNIVETPTQEISVPETSNDSVEVAPKPLEMPKLPNYTMVDDLLCPPGRQNRPPKIAIILRGPPGSGKSFVAKLIKDKEVEQGGSAPRILSLDDYFLVEKEIESKDDNGKKVTVKEMVYEYEEGMEQSYLASLIKAFKKNVTDGFFNFIILDCINEKISDYEDMWTFAKTKGFRVYVCEMEMDVQICLKRNIHNRTEDEINRIVDYFEPTPSYHQKLDVNSMLQEQAIEEVHMEDSQNTEENANQANEDSQDSQEAVGVSKWERMEAEDKLDRLDGLAKRKNDGKPQTMEDFLQVPDYYNMEDTPGKKRVRWADLEERKEQEKLRAVGFVVGHTNWDRMMDPTKGGSALTRTNFHRD
ncbi:uncharacterized protein LOC107267198 isoform X2 [Cephus cinctus]|uniref:YLP motif-containing protein 1 n=1 Tax=Cephus cinctus TaxID=211228 RepID=A0AAJ7W0L2_CEPCN|nr:uncharacterized protein LOC107267198 isoform X2 [Cephus cinctus]